MSKYNIEIKGVTVDVYDILKAAGVTCPALQHLIKKALHCGKRGQHPGHTKKPHTHAGMPGNRSLRPYELFQHNGRFKGFGQI